MADHPVSLIDRLTGSAFRTKLFLTAVVYMLAMFGLSEAGGGEIVLRIWFALALPVVWGLALLVQWLMTRPRPAFAEAIGGLVVLIRRRPLVSLFYAVAAVVIEVLVVSSAMGHPLIVDL